MNISHKQLKNLKIFNKIDTDIIEEIIKNSQRQNFLAGEVIMEQGEHPDGKGYIIEYGEVDVWVNGDQTACLGTGDIFGEIALLNEEERTATVVAKSDVTTIVLSQESLFQMIENDDHTINKQIMNRMEYNLEHE